MANVDEEELQRILDGAKPVPLAAFRPEPPSGSQGARQGLGLDMPKGTKVVFAEQVEPEVAAPPTSRVPITPKVVDLTQQPQDDMEMAYARAADREARRKQAVEAAGRQLVAGLTKTEVQPTLSAAGTSVAELLAKRKANTEAQRYNEQQRLNGMRFNFEQKEAARKAALDEQRRGEDMKYRQDQAQWQREEAARDNDRAERGIHAQQELARATFGLRKQEADIKQSDRNDKQAAGNISLFDGQLQVTPGLGDAERSKAREIAGLWNASDAATRDFQSALEEMTRHPSVETRGAVLAKLRTASAAFNSAIGGGAMSEGEARAMSQALGADVLTPAGVEAIAQKLAGDDMEAVRSITGRVRAAQDANRAAALGRLRAYGTFSKGGAGGQMSAEDAKALAWAKAHADDPRAQKILAANGGQ